MIKKKIKDDINQVISEIKKDYPKMTWRLSIFSALAGIAFYIGVLYDLTTPEQTKDKRIEQLIEKNKRLEKHIDLLTEKLDKA
ncbi:MAG: hypothetical protein Crog4KO_26050 [Crocinitomicaceae bacterium]